MRNHSEELSRRLELTPYSREEFYNCRDNYKEENEDKTMLNILQIKNGLFNRYYDKYD